MGFDSPRGATTNHQFQETEMTDGNHSTEKLTKRELFAAMAMQGICANENGWHVTESWIALAAVAQADALIAELNKETTT